MDNAWIPAWLRTTVYVLTWVGGIAGGVLLAFGQTEAAAIVASITAVLGGAVGTAYNPNRAQVVTDNR
jgi:hypothetical protein